MTGRKQSHLVAGLRLLGERWTAGPRKWIAAGENWLDTGVRYGMVGGAGYLTWRIVSSSWKLLGATVLVVCVLALRAATKAVKGEVRKPSEKPSEVSDDPRDGALPEVPPAALATLIRDVMGTLNGAHLATLATALTIRFGGAWEIPDVRALCEAHAVPVRAGVRGLGSRVSPGVHRKDLPPLPQPLPKGAVVAEKTVVIAGRPGTTTTTTAPPTTPATPTDRRVGDMRIIATDDPHNPARTHVKVIDLAARKRG